MRYILNGDFALRSWRKVPFAYYQRGFPYAKSLPMDEFFILLDCDGRHEIAPSETMERLLRQGMIRVAGETDRLNAWQEYLSCDNAYFPRLNWMLTGRCNYNCLHCFNAADFNAPATEWDAESEHRLMDEARECGINMISITGGEPLLHPRLMNILHGIHERGMFVEHLNTNGSLLTAGQLEEMKSFGCMPDMKISFDGTGYHDWMRSCKGAEETTLRAIALCLEHGFHVTAQVNVNRENRSSILPTLRMLDRMGVQRTRIIRTSESPRWLQKAPECTLTVKEYYDLMLETIRSYAEEDHRMQIRIWQFADLLPEEKSYRIYAARCDSGTYSDSLPVCQANRTMVSVTSAGEIVPCMQMSGYYEGHGISLGNVKQEGLKKLLQAGPYLDEVCKTTGELRKMNETCGSCPWFGFCCGGCRALGRALSDDTNGSDWSKCVFFREGYYRRIMEVLGSWTNVHAIPELVGE